MRSAECGVRNGEPVTIGAAAFDSALYASGSAFKSDSLSAEYGIKTKLRSALRLIIPHSAFPNPHLKVARRLGAAPSPLSFGDSAAQAGARRIELN